MNTFLSKSTLPIISASPIPIIITKIINKVVKIPTNNFHLDICIFIYNAFSLPLNAYKI